MPDFGTMLPFRKAAGPDPESWCVHMMEIAPEEITIRVGEAVKLEEAWGYFVWLPRGVKPRQFSEPELWGVTRWVPYEQLFSLVEKQSVYFMPETKALSAGLGKFLLQHADLSQRERQCLTEKVLRSQSGDELQRFRAFVNDLLKSGKLQP